MSSENEISELAEQLRETNGLIRDRYLGGNTASVKIGDSFKSGMVVGICTATCVATWIALLIFAFFMTNLWAWKDVHTKDIAKLQGEVAQLKEQRK